MEDTTTEAEGVVVPVPVPVGEEEKEGDTAQWHTFAMHLVVLAGTTLGHQPADTRWPSALTQLTLRVLTP